MKTAFYPLALSSWNEDEIHAIQKVISSNHFTMGEQVSAFEVEMAQKMNSKFCVMVNSGSSANLLMVAALFFRKVNPLKAGDEVIVPAVSWSTSYFPLQQYGLKLKFVDIDLQTLNYNLSELQSAVSDQTKMILAVNLLGNSNDFASIQKIISDRDIILIEDNCESLGARFQKQYCGTLGLMGSHSTYFSHHLSTMEGGFILTADEELYQILLCLRAHGWTRSLPEQNLVTGTKSNFEFDEQFRFALPGYNVRPLEFSAAIGREQIKKMDQMNLVRQQNALIFKNQMSQFTDFIFQKEMGESSWFGFSFLLKKEAFISRNQLVQLLQQKGVECRPIVAGNFTRHPAIQYFNYEVHNTLKNADFIHDQGFFIGNHSVDFAEQISSLSKLLQEPVFKLRHESFKSSLSC